MKLLRALCLFLFARNSSNHGSHIAVETLESSERLSRLFFSEKMKFAVSLKVSGEIAGRFGLTVFICFAHEANKCVLLW